jgi:hypothetical protein
MRRYHQDIFGTHDIDNQCGKSEIFQKLEEVCNAVTRVPER